MNVNLTSQENVTAAARANCPELPNAG